MCPWSANTVNNLATYKTTDKLYCAVNKNDFGASAITGTPAACSGHTWSWFGEPCQSQTVNTTNTDNWNQEDAFSEYMNIHCPGGMTINGNATTGTRGNFLCSTLNRTGTPGGLSPTQKFDHESVRGVSIKCASN